MNTELNRLRELQDKTVEHQWPPDQGSISYFIEAAGDIYREMCKDIPDGSYIGEKMHRLEKIFELTKGDMKSIVSICTTPDYIKRMEVFLGEVHYLLVETMKLKSDIFGIRYSILTKSLGLIIEIVKWTLHDYPMGYIDRNFKLLDSHITDFYNVDNWFDRCLRGLM